MPTIAPAPSCLSPSPPQYSFSIEPFLLGFLSRAQTAPSYILATSAQNPGSSNPSSKTRTFRDILPLPHQIRRLPSEIIPYQRPCRPYTSTRPVCSTFFTPRQRYLSSSLIRDGKLTELKDDATSGLIALMALYPPTTYFFINSWTWGYEDILKAVARHFQSKVTHFPPFLSYIFVSLA